MNYQKVYNQIIDRAKNQNRVYGKGVYYERHHITPKCIGGEGKTSQWKTHSNIVLLSAKEHFICHRLLCEVYPNSPKLKFALWAMSNQITESRGYKVGAKCYERLRQEHIALISGVPKSKETREKMSLSSKGVKKPPMTDTHRANLQQSIVGLSKSPEHRDNLSKAKSIEVYQYSLQGEYLSKWDSAKEAANALRIDAGDICQCRLGKKKSAGGFIWKGSRVDVLPYKHQNSSGILQYDLEGNFLEEYQSISLASKTLKINSSGISNCANGYSKKSGRYIWKYKPLSN